MTDFRIYANREGDFPWSIDSGTQADEVTVRDITFCDVGGYTMTDFTATRTEDSPKWWIVVHRASLEIFGDVARFYGEDREQ